MGKRKEPSSRDRASVRPVDASVLRIFDRLGNGSDEVRWEAAEALAQALKDSDEAAREYVLRRLVTGASSSRDNARLGFAVALAALVSDGTISVSDVLGEVERSFGPVLLGTDGDIKARREAAVGTLAIMAAVVDAWRPRLNHEETLNVVRILRSVAQAESVGVERRRWALDDAVLEVLNRVLPEKWDGSLKQALELWISEKTKGYGLAVRVMIAETDKDVVDMADPDLIEALLDGFSGGFPRPETEPVPFVWRRLVASSRGRLNEVWSATVERCLLSTTSREKQMTAIGLLPFAIRAASNAGELDDLVTKPFLKALGDRVYSVRRSRDSARDMKALSVIADDVVLALKETATQVEGLTESILNWTLDKDLFHQFFGQRRIRELASQTRDSSLLFRSVVEKLLHPVSGGGAEKKRDVIVDMLFGIVDVESMEVDVGRFAMAVALSKTDEQLSERIAGRMTGLALHWISKNLLSLESMGKVFRITTELKKRKMPNTVLDEEAMTRVNRLVKAGTRLGSLHIPACCAGLGLCAVLSRRMVNLSEWIDDLCQSLKSPEVEEDRLRRDFVEILVRLSAAPSAPLRSCAKSLFSLFASSLNRESIEYLFARIGGTRNEDDEDDEDEEDDENDENDDDDDDHEEEQENDVDVAEMDGDLDQHEGALPSGTGEEEEPQRDEEVDIDLDDVDPETLAAFDARVSAMLRLRASHQQAKKRSGEASTRQTSIFLDYFSPIATHGVVSVDVAIALAPKILGIANRSSDSVTAKKAAVLSKRIVSTCDGKVNLASSSLAIREAMDEIGKILRTSSEVHVVNSGVSILVALNGMLADDHLESVLDSILCDAHERRKDAKTTESIMNCLISNHATIAWRSVPHIARLMTTGRTAFLKHLGVTGLTRLVLSRGATPTLQQRRCVLDSFREMVGNGCDASEKRRRLLEVVHLAEALDKTQGYTKSVLAPAVTSLSKWDEVVAKPELCARLTKILVCE